MVRRRAREDEMRAHELVHVGEVEVELHGGAVQVAAARQADGNVIVLAVARVRTAGGVEEGLLLGDAEAAGEGRGGHQRTPL